MTSGGKVTALHWAAFLGLFDLRLELIPTNSVNQDSELGFPLHCAVRNSKDYDTLAIMSVGNDLLKTGADLNSHIQWVEHYSPLAFAVKEQSLDFIKLLLEAGALVDKDCIDELQACMTSKRGEKDTMPTCFFDSVKEKNIPQNIRP
jgi:ankyrin repeat protein